MESKYKMNYFTMYFIMKANAFIHLLSRMPLINQLLPDHVYRLFRTKKFFGYVSLLLDAAKNMMIQTATIYLLISVFPKAVYSFFELSLTTSDQILLYCIIVCLLPAGIQSKIFKLGRDDHMYLNHFKVNPKGYYKFKITKQLIASLVYSVPGLLMISNYEVPLMLFMLSFNFMTINVSNYVFTSIYHYKKAIPSVWHRAILSTCLCAVLFTVTMITNFDVQFFLSSYAYILTTILIAISLICYRKLLGYDGYLKIARNFVSKETVALHFSVTSFANEGDIALTITDNKANKAFLEDNSVLQGLNYINQAYIHRHKKIQSNFFKQRAYLLFALSVVGGMLLRYKGVDIQLNSIIEHSNYLVILILFFSFGREFTQLYFYHCDKFLLTNNMYNNRTSIYDGYIVKLKYLLGQALKMVLAITLSVIAFILLSGASVNLYRLAMLLIAYSNILIFYEVYHLLNYYLVQPYTKNNTIKKPIARIFSLVEILVFGVIFFIANNISYYAIPLLVVSLTTIVIGTFLVKRVGYITFKI